MAKIIIDNEEIECRDGIPVLQAALEAGKEVPHYCYHPGLSVVASCRLCLMEMKMPHPKTREMGWAPKLMPSCQTPVRDGMEVRFNTEKVEENQKDCMEFFLLNHPLDCPVCDQAGECHLQDYSYAHGRSESRMVDQKTKNPKKDIGPNTLLYADRCVLCTRCIRFTEEITGTSELCLVNRGSRNEIDVFPGVPLDNPLQGNVVDLCPVGCLLDKNFLFQRRVWELSGADSICPGCATGCAVRVDHADEKVYRLKPRFNPGVNDWWMCDEGRFGFDYVHDAQRVTTPLVRRGKDQRPLEWNELAEIARFRFTEHVREHGGASVVAVLSPFMSCEEAWLLARFVREVAPESTLVMGPVPTEGDVQRFPAGAEEAEAKFTISPEKCPNRRGVEMILGAAGGEVISFEAFVERAGTGDFSAAWVAGGYPKPWVEKDVAKLATKFSLLVAQDLFENAFVASATVVLPARAWVEREGCFVNAGGKVQPFHRAIRSPDGGWHDGQYLHALAGFEGLYHVGRVRELMAATMPAFENVMSAPPKPAHAH